MFSQATREFYNIKTQLQENTSRLSSCENQIYHLNNDMYDTGPLWSKVRENESQVNELIETVATLSADISKFAANIQELTMQMQDLKSKLRPDLDAKTVNPKQNSHLEILEEKDPFITPEYYLDREKDYWYWNGEDI